MRVRERHSASGQMESRKSSWKCCLTPEIRAATVNLAILIILLCVLLFVGRHLFLFLWLQRVWPDFEKWLEWGSAFVGLVHGTLFMYDRWWATPPAAKRGKLPRAASPVRHGKWKVLNRMTGALNVCLAIFLCAVLFNLFSAESPTQVSVRLPHSKPIKFLLVTPPIGGKAISPLGQTLFINEPYYLAACELTEEQWHAVMGTQPDSALGDEHPASHISWDQAQEFLRRLNRTARDSRLEFRLPRWMEWEYACEAERITPFFWGNSIAPAGKYLWGEQDSNGHPHPVGQKSPNPWGFYDILGNVAEWCNDAWTPGALSRSDQFAPRATCGGGFKDDFSEAKLWIKDLARNQKQDDVGLRLAASRKSNP
jgi:hypothetical protein